MFSRQALNPQLSINKSTEMIHYSDGLERQLGEALTKAGIRFVHESQNKAQGLDFYLPDHDVYIEVKRYHAERIERQMASKDNVIAIQGKPSLDFFIKHLLAQLLQPLPTPLSFDNMPSGAEIVEVVIHNSRFIRSDIIAKSNKPMPQEVKAVIESKNEKIKPR